MSNELTVQNMQGMELYKQMAVQMKEESTEMEYTYPSAYVRVLHPSSQIASDYAPGSLQVSFSREDQMFTQVIAALPMDLIGTSGAFAKSNPTPRQWRTDVNNPDLLNKFGYSMCRSAGHFKPDPLIWQDGPRMLTHPDANNRSKVIASAGWNSDKTVEVPTAYEINSETDCRECPFSRTWFSTEGEPLLQQVCRPQYQGVFYLVGALGEGKLPQDRRTLAQVTMSGQAARTVFVPNTKNKSGQNDAEYQKSVGIQQPMSVALYNKEYAVPNMEGFVLQANQVFIPEVRSVLTLPLLIAGILHKEKVGQSAIPFVYNPALAVREYMRTSTESDPEQKLMKALSAAVEDFARRIKLLDVQHGKKQIFDLLGATMVNSDDLSVAEEARKPYGEELLREYLQVRAEYHNEVDGLKEGREKLTTPFRATTSQASTTQFSEADAEASEEDTGVEATAQPEVQAQELLSKLNNSGSFNFVQAEEDEPVEGEYVEEEDDEEEDEGPIGFFQNPFND